MIETARDAPIACPVCSKKNGAATSPWGEVPKPGDISVCAYCASILQFVVPTNFMDALLKDDQLLLLTLRPVTDDEWRALQAKAPEVAASAARARAAVLTREQNHKSAHRSDPPSST